ncbi:STAS/SEC14 domain-containing protein [Chryseobacterium formosus]|uniref:STAS/SEC14 domain-containing protein n=1 Tax=Chryseobacterium formosus TaxID=1537363 RepID=A0ABT3XNP6_9FLAO|nr:STAS/SEC14 domain-containing protein [Chryseobacterium formosus]MCX8523112.1 STAS/SEC14 domain-containing protein [Chryseobacterium formosus]
MITILNDAPENVAAFNATGEINREDFENLVIPHVKNKVAKFDELNYMLYLDTDLENADVKTWLTNSLSDLNTITAYNRAAIVSNNENAKKFSDLDGFSNFKFFSKDNVYHALYWCNNGNEHEK